MPMSISRLCRNEGSLPIATISLCSFSLPATASKTLSVCANPSKRLHFAATTRLRREAEASYRAGRWQDGWTFEYEAGATECAGRICLPSTVSKLQHSRSFLLMPQIRTS